MIHQGTGERMHNRLLLMFYDSLALLCIWFMLFAPYLSGAEARSSWQMLLNAAWALVSFLGFRLLLRVYKQILRTGSVHAFAREMVADILAAASYVLLCHALSLGNLPLSKLILFAAVYIIISILGRLAYFYLY